MPQLAFPAPGDVAAGKVAAALDSIAKSRELIREGISQAVDEIVDPVRSGRWELDQLDQPEKTVIGIRVENILRMALELKRGTRLDLEIAGTEVDVKFSLSEGWMIPPEAVGEICLLTSYRDSDGTVSAGLLRTSDSVLNHGANRDGKRTVRAAAKADIEWLVRDEVPDQSLVGFMKGLPDSLRGLITDHSVGAQERLNRLFAARKAVPIPEIAVEAIAQHKDWTRRLRPDARNPKGPAQRGYEVLRQSSPTDRQELKRRGLPPLKRGYCVALAVRP